MYTTPLFSQEEIEIIIKHTGKDSSKMVFKTSSISFTLIVSLYMHLRFVIGQESLNIPSNVQPEFTIANSVLQKATLDKIDRIKKLRDKHQSVASEHPDMKKVTLSLTHSFVHSLRDEHQSVASEHPDMKKVTLSLIHSFVHSFIHCGTNTKASPANIQT